MKQGRPSRERVQRDYSLTKTVSDVFMKSCCLMYDAAAAAAGKTQRSVAGLGGRWPDFCLDKHTVVSDSLD